MENEFYVVKWNSALSGKLAEWKITIGPSIFQSLTSIALLWRQESLNCHKSILVQKLVPIEFATQPPQNLMLLGNLSLHPPLCIFLSNKHQSESSGGVHVPKALCNIPDGFHSDRLARSKIWCSASRKMLLADWTPTLSAWVIKATNMHPILPHKCAKYTGKWVVMKFLWARRASGAVGAASSLLPRVDKVFGLSAPRFSSIGGT
jgi:hypothetical protein